MSYSEYPELTSEVIHRAIRPYRVELSQAQADTVKRYIEILLLWNQKISLTSLNNPLEILRRHFGESMFAVGVVPILKGRLADVGSGAGFPGLAIKVLCNELDVMLIEPNYKKVAFLEEVVRALELSGVDVQRGRIPDLSMQPRSLDFVTARAVGSFSTLLRRSRTVLKERGQLVLWVGEKDARGVSATAGWSWREPILLPQSRNRILLVGRPRLA